jgi:hypothetical protein
MLTFGAAEAMASNLSALMLGGMAVQRRPLGFTFQPRKFRIIVRLLVGPGGRVIAEGTVYQKLHGIKVRGDRRAVFPD